MDGVPRLGGRGRHALWDCWRATHGGMSRGRCTCVVGLLESDARRHKSGATCVVRLLEGDAWWHESGANGGRVSGATGGDGRVRSRRRRDLHAKKSRVRKNPSTTPDPLSHVTPPHVGRPSNDHILQAGATRAGFSPTMPRVQCRDRLKYSGPSDTISFVHHCTICEGYFLLV